MRRDLLITLFLSGLVPVFIAVALLYSQLHISEREANLAFDQTVQQVRSSLSGLMNASKVACDGLTFSSELNDFMQAPADLRLFSENRLYGKVVEWEQRSPLPINWQIFDGNGVLVFSKGTNAVLKPKEVKSGVSLSADKSLILIKSGIQFDDQGLSNPNAQLLGEIVCGLETEKFRGAESRLASFNSISSNGDLGPTDFTIQLRRSANQNRIWFFVITTIGFLLASTSAGFLRLRKRVLAPIEDLTSKIGVDVSSDGNYKEPNEIKLLESTIEQHLLQMQRRQGELIRQAEVEALAQVSTQVAHDIRSPLAALEIVVNELSSLPEEQRLIVRRSTNRIRDISNDLLKTNVAGSEERGTDEVRPELLSGLVDLILSEKRTQYRSRGEIEIHSGIGTGAYGVFARVSPREFKRVISNLVNNAVEAMDRGSVIVETRVSEGQAVVEVRDSGKGIPPEMLHKLGKKGFSEGKTGSDSGSGLGLFHAYRCVEAWGGRIEVKSEQGKGTSFHLILPLASTPNWFPQDFCLNEGEAPVVIDDDPSVLQAWSNRFATLSIENFKHFSSPNAFSDWFEKDGRRGAYRYFCDYEFLGAKENGLDLIERLGIAPQSALVTSRFEEVEVRKRAEALRVKVLPKGLVAYVPIRQGETALANNGLDAVLLDGDPLIQKIWKFSAKQKNKSLRCFSTSKELLAALNEIDKSTSFYIDSNLEIEKGEDVAKLIYDKGYKHLYLATGYSPSHFGEMPWIKGILGKEPPWL